MNYRLKLLLGLVLVSVPMLAILTINRMVIIENLTYQRELNRINTLGVLLAFEIEDDLVRGDTAAILEVLDIVAREPFLSVVSVIDDRGVVRFSSDTTLVGGVNPYPDIADIRQTPGDTFFTSFGLREAAPLTRFQIGYDLSQTHADFLDALVWAIALDIAILGATLLIAWIISGVLQRPLVRMRFAARQIAAGDFSVRLSVPSRDIIGLLTQDLNAMAERLGDLTANMRQKIDNATRELTQSNARLRELDRLKSDFVAMVSHELRTPLTLIIGFAQTLLALTLTPEQQRTFLKTIEQEGKRLSYLIEEYLDISKIEAGSFTLKESRFDLVDLLFELVDSIGGQTPMALRFPVQGVRISADRERIRRVIINLIDNAVKYGGAHPFVGITAQSTQQGVQVMIDDNGPGVPEEERKRIFEKFRRGSTADGKGSGLGLAIAKGILEAHGGTVYCAPAPGTGARFVVELPSDRVQSG